MSWVWTNPQCRLDEVSLHRNTQGSVLIGWQKCGDCRLRTLILYFPWERCFSAITQHSLWCSRLQLPSTMRLQDHLHVITALWSPASPTRSTQPYSLGGLSVTHRPRLDPDRIRCLLLQWFGSGTRWCPKFVHPEHSLSEIRLLRSWEPHTGHPLTFEFQVNNKLYFHISMS